MTDILCRSFVSLFYGSTDDVLCVSYYAGSLVYTFHCAAINQGFLHQHFRNVRHIHKFSSFRLLNSSFKKWNKLSSSIHDQTSLTGFTLDHIWDNTKYLIMIFVSRMPLNKNFHQQYFWENCLIVVSFYAVITMNHELCFGYDIWEGVWQTSLLFVFPLGKTKVLERIFKSLHPSTLQFVVFRCDSTACDWREFFRSCLGTNFPFTKLRVLGLLSVTFSNITQSRGIVSLVWFHIYVYYNFIKFIVYWIECCCICTKLFPITTISWIPHLNLVSCPNRHKTFLLVAVLRELIWLMFL